MDGDGKKPLKTAITDFYNLNLKKEKNMQWNTSKKVCTGLQSLGGLKSLKPLEIAIENMDPEGENQLNSCCKSKWTTKPFEVLKWFV